MWGFPCGSAGKESTCNVGDLASIPGLGRSPGEGKGYSLQYSGLENSMDLYSPWGHRELDTTEWPSLSLFSGDYGVKLSAEKLHILSTLEWPSFGVVWPSGGTLDVPIVWAVHSHNGKPWPPGPIPIYQSCSDIAQLRPLWVQFYATGQRECKVLVAQPKKRTLHWEGTTYPPGWGWRNAFSAPTLNPHGSLTKSSRSAFTRQSTAFCSTSSS